ncbi:peptidoglycan-binding domain-containing protein [Woodsholea maritima]|uniref:peptidoglycan-binding domain-containing protein n=1 Tax=Woodsholea maritima TaxID=240237 RepID=UPI00037D2BAE|nr:peptidoglycan-binding domain-containing protein [Woodsholea maritima]
MDAYYEKLSELLQFHDIIRPSQELDETNVKEAVMAFQDHANLYVDGVAGPNTLWALQIPYYATQSPMAIQTLDADPTPQGMEGLANFTLRADAAKAFRLIAKTVDEMGAKLHSSGGLRSLSAQSNASRSAKSMHYPGLAIDLCINAGFFHPDTDPYVITRVGEKSWTVWARAAHGTAQMLEAVYWRGPWTGGEVLTKIVEGAFINLTKLFAKHGFSAIAARAGFLRASNRLYLSAEWWHFQAEGLLVPRLSQLGVELLRIKSYTPALIEARNATLWANHRAIFKKNWW